MNGEEAIEKSISVIKEALQLAVDWNDQKEMMPISLMLLDFQMPRKNGF